MAIRILSSLLIALALLVAPLGLGGPTLAAATPTAEVHHGEGHCGGTEPAEERQSPIHLGCASSCAAVPSVEPGMGRPVMLAPHPPMPATSAALVGVAPERETPPPRTVR